MAKRAGEFSKEIGLDIKELIAVSAQAGVTVKNMMTAIEDEDRARILAHIERSKKESVVEKRVAGGVIRRRVAARPASAEVHKDQRAEEPETDEAPPLVVPEAVAPKAEAEPQEAAPEPPVEVHAPASAPEPEPIAPPPPAPEPEPAPAPEAPAPLPAPEPIAEPSAPVSASVPEPAPAAPTPPPASAEPAEESPVAPEMQTEGQKRGFRKPRQISTIVKRIDVSELQQAAPPPRRPPYGGGPGGPGGGYGGPGGPGGGYGGPGGPRRPMGPRPSSLTPIPVDLPPTPDPLGMTRRRPAKHGEKESTPHTVGDSDNSRARGTRKRQVIDESYMERRMRSGPKRKDKRGEMIVNVALPKGGKRLIKLGTDTIIVSELAKRMGIKANELILKLIKLGLRVNINQAIDLDTATILASEFGFEVENVAFEEENFLPTTTEDPSEQLINRAPVVTVMGHVDHGKTSILDYIRKSEVAAGEAGGITQHIGAYMVHRSKGDITFIDTPGHAAFTAMRARGAQITDIVILVVAADDGVMPQTIEAINHARGANVPIIVAINKMDKPQANPDRVKKELMMHSLIPEELGGDIIMVPVSAKSGMGIDALLEMVLLQAEVLELRANPQREQVDAVVIEAKLDRGRGPVATVLMRHGTLRVGDYFVCGAQSGKVKALVNDAGLRITEATPSMPVEVLGFEEVPAAGEMFNSMSDEKQAKLIAENRYHKKRESELAKTSRVSLEELVERVKAGDIKTLSLVVKGDVQGTVGALRDSLGKLGSDEVKIEIIHSGAGGITESDVLFAAASKALIIGFNVRPETKAQVLAEKEGVEIKVYSIIYDVIEDIKNAVLGLTAPTIREEQLGRIEVREIFTIPKVGTIAGCYVLEGKVTRQAQVRVLRDNVVIHTGRLASLKRFKDDASEVLAGYECGLAIESYNDIKVGDILESFVSIVERAK